MVLGEDVLKEIPIRRRDHHDQVGRGFHSYSSLERREASLLSKNKFSGRMESFYQEND
jgi:hypothetical protein